MGDAALAADPDFATNVERVKRRAETDGRVAAVFGALDVDALVQKLAAADIAFAASTARRELAGIRICAASPSARRAGRCPIRRRRRCGPASRGRYGAVPALGEHSEKIRAEFKRLETLAAVIPGRAAARSGERPGMTTQK